MDTIKQQWVTFALCYTIKPNSLSMELKILTKDKKKNPLPIKIIKNNRYKNY
jgi:hypothetical protein